MTILIVISAVLVGIAALATGWVVLRGAVRGYLNRRLLAQTKAVRKELKKLRDADAKSMDKLLIELRDTYDVRAIEDELQMVLEKGDGPGRLVRAFDLLGLTDRYLREIQHSNSWRARAQAASALGALGEVRAIPLLLDRMRDPREDDDVKLVSAESLGRIRDPSVIPVLCQELGSVDEWASPRLAQVLTSFGKDAVAPLLVSLQSGANLNASMWSAQVLGKLDDPRAVVPLLSRLHDRSERMRMSAAVALGDLGDRRAVQPLIDIVLRDPVAAVRAQAAAALGRIGDEAALPLLVGALGDPEYWMRFRALEAIEILAPEDPKPIESALVDPNPEVRRRAAFALDRLGFLERPFTELGDPDPEKAQAAQEELVLVGRAGLSERLVRYLESTENVVRARIADILGLVGAPEHTPALVAILGDEDIDVRVAVIRALGELRSAGTAFNLVPHLSHDERAVRDAATEALSRFLPDELEELRGQIISLLHEESDEVRACAARVLGSVPGEAADNALISALKQRYVEVRFAAVQSLGARGTLAAVEPLAASLEDVSPRTRLAAAEALGAIATDEAVQYLLDHVPKADASMRDSICDTLAERGFEFIQGALDVMLATDDIESRLGAIWTLGKTRDPRAAEILALLITEDEERLRSSAAGALGKIKSEVGSKALVRSLRDPSPRVRAASVNALGRVGGEEALPPLCAKLNDPDGFVRNRALLAVGRLGGEGATRVLVEEHDMIDDVLDPAFRSIALALTGDPEAIAIAIGRVADRAIRARVESILEREDDVVRKRFYEAMDLGKERDDTSSDEKLDPGAIVIHYAGLLRNSPDAAARRQAAVALSRLDDVAAIEAVGESIQHDPEPDVRNAAVEALARRPTHPAAKSALTVAARDPIAGVRMRAIRALGEAVNPDDAEVLLGAMRSRHASVRSAAERAVASVFAGSVGKFQDWMMGSDDDAVRMSALRVLGRIKDASSLGLIREIMRSEEPAVRVEAGKVLAALNAWDAIEVLFDSMSDPVESVRVGLVEALGTTAREDVCDRLVEVALDPSAHVRETLVATAFQLNFESAVSLLARMCRDAEPKVAARAVLSLMEHKHHTAAANALDEWELVDDDVRRLAREQAQGTIAHLSDRLRKELDAERREQVLRLLIGIDCRGNADIIAEGLKDPDAAVRLAAVHGLGTLDLTLVADWIRELLNDPVQEVRLAARRVLFKAL